MFSSTVLCDNVDDVPVKEIVSGKALSLARINSLSDIVCQSEAKHPKTTRESKGRLVSATKRAKTEDTKTPQMQNGNEKVYTN